MSLLLTLAVCVVWFALGWKCRGFSDEKQREREGRAS